MVIYELGIKNESPGCLLVIDMEILKGERRGSRGRLGLGGKHFNPLAFPGLLSFKSWIRDLKCKNPRTSLIKHPQRMASGRMN